MCVNFINQYIKFLHILSKVFIFVDYKIYEMVREIKLYRIIIIIHCNDEHMHHILIYLQATKGEKKGNLFF